MRAIRILAVLSLVMFTVTACHHRKHKKLKEEDVAAIHEIAAAYKKALLAGDWEAWTNLFSEDFKYMIPNMPMVEGRAKVLEVIKGSKPFPEASMKIVQLEGKWKIAVARGTYTYTMAEQHEGVPMKDTGKFLWLLKRKKQDDKWGKWEIAIECYNSDLPLPKQ
jgi:ketosteroid isomerase-like protein